MEKAWTILRYYFWNGTAWTTVFVPVLLIFSQARVRHTLVKFNAVILELPKSGEMGYIFSRVPTARSRPPDSACSRRWQETHEARQNLRCQECRAECSTLRPINSSWVSVKAPWAKVAVCRGAKMLSPDIFACCVRAHSLPLSNVDFFMALAVCCKLCLHRNTQRCNYYGGA